MRHGRDGALTGSAILPGEPALHLPSNPVIGLALLLALTAACAPVCLDGKPPRVEPCHTVVIHRVTGVRLSVDRPVQGWTLRSGGAVLPLVSEPVSLPLSAAGAGAEVFLEGPRGEKLALPPAPIRDDGRSAESHLVLPGDEPATVSIQWSIATDVSECHGAPPETTCGSAAQTARRLVSSRV